MNNPAPQQNAKPPTTATPATPAANRRTATTTPTKERKNIWRFNISGHIEFDRKKSATVVAASEAVEAALATLIKAGAIMTKDEGYATSMIAGEDDTDEE